MVGTPAVLAPQAAQRPDVLSAANSMHCHATQDIASPDEEWVEGVHAATQAAQEDLLISNTRLMGSGQGAYDASRMSTVRQLRMLVSLREMTVADAHAACSVCDWRTLSQPRRQRAASCRPASHAIVKDITVHQWLRQGEHARG
jgi:hypothetical protein